MNTNTNETLEELMEHEFGQPQSENMPQPKSKKGLSKQERKASKDFRRNRKNARGRGWQGDGGEV